MNYSAFEILHLQCILSEHVFFIQSTILRSFFSQPEFPSLLQNTTVGFLTVLVPFAIALFQTALSAKTNNDDSAEFDLFVIIDGVIKYRWLLVSLFLCFSPTIIWNASGIPMRILEFLSWCIGIGILITILNSNVEWVKGGANKIRLRFIKSLNISSPDLIKVWTAIWSTKDSLQTLENEFLQVFSDQLNGLLRAQKWSTVEEMLDGFINNLEKRSTFALLSMSSFFSEILKWHKIFWVNAKALHSNRERMNEWGQQSELMRKTTDLFLNILIKVIDLGHLSILIDKFQRHIEENQSLGISTTDEDPYIDSLLGTFMNVLLEKVDEHDRQYQIWRWIFPQEWKLSFESIKGTKKKIVFIVFNQFLRWAIEQIDKDQRNYYVDHILSELIPNTDPIIWARLIIFCFAPTDDDRVNSIVRRGWNFGYLGRIVAYTGEPNEEQLRLARQSEEKNTFQLLRTIHPFSTILSLQNIERYLRQLSEFNPDNQIEEHNKQWLQLIFNKLKDFIENEEDSSHQD